MYFAGPPKKNKSLVSGVSKEVEKRKQKTPKKSATNKNEKKSKEAFTEKEKENEPTTKSPEHEKTCSKMSTPKIMLAVNGKEKKDKSVKKMKRIIRPCDSSDEEGHLQVSFFSLNEFFL